MDSGLSGGGGGGGGGRKRSAQRQVNYTVIVGMAEDEASEALLAEAEVAQGMGPAIKDKYFRTLVRRGPDCPNRFCTYLERHLISSCAHGGRTSFAFPSQVL